jgi:hypothetical protein
MTNDSTQAATGVVDTHAAAPLLGVRADTLKAWRHRGIGPPYVRLADRGRVRYRLRDLETWLAERTVIPQPRPASLEHPP